MKQKKLLRIMLFIIVFLMVKNVYAFDSSNYRYRALCDNYELASFKADGTITSIGCYQDYQTAKNEMHQKQTADLAIMTKINGITKIIDANVALLDLTVNPESLTYYYTTSEATGYTYTYMDNSSSYGGVDGAHIETAYSNSLGTWVAKVKIANFTGWIKQSTYEIVPITWVKSSNYYNVTDNDIRHNYVSKIQNTYNGNSGRTIGPKPEGLTKGTYYSYDGHYFYTNLETMIRDYKNNHYDNAVNKNNPYYNYYMYLSNHTKTTYSSINIDEYIRNNLGFKRNVYGNAASNGTSRLYGSGTFFYYAQEKYGVNAILSLSLSRNETANGTSNLSINKNNGFGLNAVDSNPTQAANWYPSFASSILGYASKWITYGYTHPRDWRYFGPQFGDKWIGMNVKYASDAYWSEKMAANYYSFDKAFGLQDYNYYQLGVVTTSIPAYKEPSTSSKVIYTYTEKEDAVVIIEELTRNNEKWYKVVSDLNIDDNGNEKTSGNYNWNNYVYVRAAQVTKINNGKNGPTSPNSVFEYVDKNYEYDLYIENAELKPKVAITTKNTSYYYDSSLSSSTGVTLLKDRYVMVYTAAYENGMPVSYLVTSDYWHDQKEWVSADSIKFTNTSYGKVSVNVSGNQYTWVNYNTEDAQYSVISGLYTNSYVPLLEELQVGNDTWFKVPVSLTDNNNIYGYTLKYFPGVSVTPITPVMTNNRPTITASDKEIEEQSTFNAKENVTAYDQEDGDITNKIEVIENTVNTNKPGTYKVTYKVADSANQEVSKTITVTVKEDKTPTITAKDKTLYVGEEFNPKQNVTANDPEDGDITNKIEVIENTVNTNQVGIYKVIYKVTDSKNHSVTKEIKVTIIENIEINLEEINLDDYEEKESIFYFDYLKEVDHKLQIKGYNVIRGIDNSLDTEIEYLLMFKSLNKEEVYIQQIDRITNKNEITRPVNSSDTEDYTYSWFKGNIDLENIPEGDYELYIVSFGERLYYSKSLITNKVLRTQVASFQGEKQVTTRNNYYSNDLPLELIIRSEKIGDKTATSTYNMYNQYRTLEFKNNKLHLKGTAYSYGMDLSPLSQLDRKIIFENTNNYQKYKYDLGSTTEGLYTVGTTLGDNLGKDKAWFDKEIDIKDIPKGTYAIYISNVANIKDYGELNEILGRDLSKISTTINNKKYSFQVNKENRYRIELIIE